MGGRRNGTPAGSDHERARLKQLERENVERKGERDSQERVRVFVE
jgi:hypothetical protein